MISSRGNSLRVRLGDPIEGFRIGNRGDLEISCVARDSLGDFLGSMLILLVKGQTKSLQRRQANEKGLGMQYTKASAEHLIRTITFYSCKYVMFTCSIVTSKVNVKHRRTFSINPYKVWLLPVVVST